MHIGPMHANPLSKPGHAAIGGSLALLLSLLATVLALPLPGALAATSVPAVSTSGSSHVTYSSVILYGNVNTPGRALTPPGPPNVPYSSVILYGNVNARGLATDYVFQYGTTSGYGGQTPLAPAGNGTISIKLSQSVSGLQPGTTYHYRIVAVNSAGTANGNDRTFNTAAVPLSVQIAGVPNPVAFGNPF